MFWIIAVHMRYTFYFYPSTLLLTHNRIVYLFQVIAAEGEQKASRALKEAAEVIAQSPAALQLRYLQTLNTISAEKNSTIIFPLPIDFLSHFLPASSKQQHLKPASD